MPERVSYDCLSMRTQARLLAGMALGAVRKLREVARQAARRGESIERATLRVDASPSLHGSRVLITGSTRGIGLALAEALAQRGAVVAVHGRREAAAGKLAHKLSARGRAVGLGADLAQPGAGRRLVEQCVAQLGGLDLVINNAAIHGAGHKPIAQTEGEELHELLRVNVLAPFEICAAAVRHMHARDQAGRILNISSGAADRASASNGGIASYAMSKQSLETLSAFLAAENERVTVTTLRPDYIDTDMVADLFPLDRRLRMLPPASVVPAALYLATAPRAEVHGKVFEQLALTQQLACGEPVQPVARTAGP